MVSFFETAKNEFNDFKSSFNEILDLEGMLNKITNASDQAEVSFLDLKNAA